MKKFVFLIIILILINTIAWAYDSQRVVGKILEVKRVHDIYTKES